jgi:hypothetical protein
MLSSVNKNKNARYCKDECYLFTIKQQETKLIPMYLDSGRIKHDSYSRSNCGRLQITKIKGKRLV